MNRWEPGLAGWLALTTAVLVALAVASVSVYGTRLLGDLADAEARARAELAVSSASETLQQELDQLGRAVNLLAARPTLQQLLLEPLQDGLENYLERYCADAALDACAVVRAGEYAVIVGETVEPEVLPALVRAGDRAIVAGESPRTTPLAFAATTLRAGNEARVLAIRRMDDAFLSRVSESVGLETRLVRHVPGTATLEPGERDVQRRPLAANQNRATHYLARAYVGVSPASSPPLELQVVLPVEDVLAPVAALERRMQWTAAAVALLAILSSVLIGRYWIRGVRRLTAAARRIGRGDLDSPVTPEHGAEMRVLAHTLERMRLNLLSLEGARRVRDTILANISHEFRTPLAAQLASIELLRDGMDSMPAGDRARLVKSVEHGARRLAWLIDNLLESVRIESGQLGIRRQQVLPAEVVAGARELVGPLLDRRGQAIEVEGISALPAVTGDRERLTQVFVNLLANASKFAPPGSTIRIGARNIEPARIRLWVEDEGRGPADADHALLFEAFRRSAGDDPEESGLGLGLFIVKSIVERHGGRAWLERTAEARTRANLELPVHGAA